MEFLNSIFLYSALAIAIPIALHFWHQKKGKLLDWAAMNWLLEKDSLPSKGIKFEQLLLLLLRCLLLLILTLWLSRLLIKGFESDEKSKIHLVQASKKVVEAFRFELETALQKGEKIYWIDEKTLATKDLNFKEIDFKVAGFYLQKSLNKISQYIDNESIEIYFLNQRSTFSNQNIFVPAAFNLHFINDSTIKNIDYLTLENQKKIGINTAGKLVTDANFDGEELHSGKVDILINLINLNEQKAVIAAFEAIKSVYGLSFSSDLRPVLNKKYDIIIGEINAEIYSKNALILETSSNENFDAPNLIHLENELSMQTSEAVFAGKLPELILQKIIEFYTLNTDSQLLNENEIKNKFIERKDFKLKKENNNQILMLFFILVLILERYVALKKNES